ncbi:MAG: transposase zinc-binding domain-containing protein [Nannocystales bacterium]
MAQCRRCGDALRVPFACKSRGGCPSCMGRRMCESATLLMEHRFPAVPWRQWVLSRGADGRAAGLRQALARTGVPAFRQEGDADAASTDQA